MGNADSMSSVNREENLKKNQKKKKMLDIKNMNRNEECLR